jgi:hypothetical protein
MFYLATLFLFGRKEFCEYWAMKVTVYLATFGRSWRGQSRQHDKLQRKQRRHDVKGNQPFSSMTECWQDGGLI